MTEVQDELMKWADNGNTTEENRLRKIIACAAICMDKNNFNYARKILDYGETMEITLISKGGSLAD